MNRFQAQLLIIGGLVSSLLTTIGFWPEYGPLNAGQPEFATVVLLTISLGFVVTGWFWFQERASGQIRYEQVPALILGLISITSIVGSLVVFQPWQYAGMAGGLRTIITGAFIIAGIGLGLSGYNWFRQREIRYPLALLVGLLAMGLFYLAHQRLDFNISIPLLAILVTAVVLLPVIAVLYGIAPRSSAQ